MKPYLESILTVVYLTVSTICICQDWSMEQKLVASDRAPSDQFGNSVAISNNYAVVAARFESEDEVGGSTMTSAGSVYVYELSGGIWTEVQKLVPSDRAASDLFGSSVAIEGDFLVVGASREDEDEFGTNMLQDAGSVYIFKRDGAGTWNEIQKIVASDRGMFDEFGHDVALSGNFLIVSAIAEDEDEFGGGTLTDPGSAYIFEKDGSETWNEIQKIAASDRASNGQFGVQVDIDGDFIVIGANGEAKDELGFSPLTAAGAVYVFQNFAGTWFESQKICPTDRGAGDNFGYSVTVHDEWIAVSALLEDEDESATNTLADAGSVYTFKRDGSDNWYETQKIVPNDREASDYYGESVDIYGNTLVVSTPWESHDEFGGSFQDNAGSAYVYELEFGLFWENEEKIAAPVRQAFDWFGWNIAVGSSGIIVGALTEDENESEMGTLASSGSAYFYKTCKSYNTIDATACGAYSLAGSSTTFSSTGVYQDTILNSAGCDSIVTINLTILEALDTNINEFTCSEYTSPSGMFIWYSSGIYTDTLTSIAGCDSVLTINLTVGDPSVSIVANDGVLSVLNPSATYTWIDCMDPDNYLSFNEQFEPLTDGDYAVIITDANACTDTSDCLPIKVIDIPSAFSPNGDGVNDTFQLGLKEPPNSVTIYNRWGDVIRSFSEYDDDIEVWDGTWMSGIRVPQGTYFYQIENGETITGWVQVVW